MILFDDTTSASNARSTHAVDIFAFVEAQEIPTDYFETPYVLAPAPGAERVYAMLRETLRMTRKIGIAYVVIQARPQLAALLPQGEGLVLNTLRWAGQDRNHEMFDYPFAEEDVFHLGDDELVTAARMADSMDGMWDDSIFRQYGPAELQAFGGDEYEDDEDDETGETGLLLDTVDEDEELEDGYLASILMRARRHPATAAAARHRRSPGRTGSASTATVPGTRARMRARRH